MRENRIVGLTFIDLLQVVFIVLKLIGKINWSWWWVLSPLWIEGIIVIVIGIITFIVESIKYKNEDD